MACNKYVKKILKYKNRNLFVVFYMNPEICPYSRNALEYLKDNQFKFKGYCIKDPATGYDKKEEFFNCLKNSTKVSMDPGHNTFPTIFYKGEFVGGFSELEGFCKKQVNIRSTNRLRLKIRNRKGRIR